MCLTMAEDQDNNEFAFKCRLLQICGKLQHSEVESLAWFAGEDFPDNQGDAKSNAFDLLQRLKVRCKITSKDSTYLKRLLLAIDRLDLAQLIPDLEGAAAATATKTTAATATSTTTATTTPTRERRADGEDGVCGFRMLLYKSSLELTENQVKDMRFLADIPKGRQTSTAISIFSHLMRKYGGNKMEVAKQLIQILKGMERDDLALEVTQHFVSTGNDLADFPLSVDKQISSRPPKSARLLSRFNVRTLNDKEKPYIRNVLLLSGGRVLVTDGGNSKLKVFDSQGKFLCEKGTKNKVNFMARWTESKVYVLDMHGQGLVLVDISDQGIKILHNYPVCKKYWFLARLADRSLAVNVSERNFQDKKWWPTKVIDIISSHGKFLRSINTSGLVWFLCATSDNCIIYTDCHKIYKINTTSGAELFVVQVPEVAEPHGIAETVDGSLIVCTGPKASLAVCSSHAKYDKDLFEKPFEEGVERVMAFVSLCDNLCVCTSAYDTTVNVVELVNT